MAHNHLSVGRNHQLKNCRAFSVSLSLAFLCFNPEMRLIHKILNGISVFLMIRLGLDDVAILISPGSRLSKRIQQDVSNGRTDRQKNWFKEMQGRF